MAVDGEVKQEIAKALKLPVERLGDNVKLEEVGAESLDIIEIIFALEERFDISISVKTAGNPASQSEIDLSQLATIGDICRAVQTLVDAKSAR